MIDYLLVFPDAETALSAMVRSVTEEGTEYAYPDCMRVQVMVSDPDFPGVVDEETGEVTSVGVRPSESVWWAVARPVVDPDLWASDYTVLEASRPDEPTPWADCILRHKLPQAEMDGFLRFSPVWAGSRYEFA